MEKTQNNHIKIMNDTGLPNIFTSFHYFNIDLEAHAETLRYDEESKGDTDRKRRGKIIHICNYA